MYPFNPGRFQWKDKAFKACLTIDWEVNGNSGSSRFTENPGARARDNVIYGDAAHDRDVAHSWQPLHNQCILNYLYKYYESNIENL